MVFRVVFGMDLEERMHLLEEATTTFRYTSSILKIANLKLELLYRRSF